MEFRAVSLRRNHDSWCWTLALIASLFSIGVGHADDRVPYSSIKQIKENPVLGHPVQFTATVTFADALWGVIFVQDATDAIYVAAHWERNPLPGKMKPGTKLEIGGIVAGGEADPIVGEAACRVIDEEGAIPDPVPVDLSVRSYTEFDSHWITLEAEIVDVVHSGVHVFASAVSKGERLWAHIPPYKDRGFVESLPGSRVQLTGALGINLGEHQKILGPLVYLAEESQLVVLERPQDRTAPEDLGLVGWSQSSPDALTGLEVRLSGQVTHVRQNDVFFLENRGRVARVQSHSCQMLSVGEFVEVKGMVEHNRSGYVYLTAEHIQKTHYDPINEPARVHSASEVISKNSDGQYIAIEGHLLAFDSEDHRHQLEVKDGEHVFQVHFVASPEEMQSLRLHDATKLQFQGVCDFSGGDGTFKLYVNSIDHVNVLKRPIEVGLQVALVSLALVGLVAIGYAVWARQLKSRVAEKTATLREVTARLRSTNEAIHDAILVGSPEGEVLEVNHRVNDLFGLQVAPGDSVVALQERMASCFEDGEGSRQEWQRFFAAGGDETMTVTMHMSTPQRREICAFTAPVLGSSGEDFGRLWMFEDRTEQMELEESLTRSQKMEAVGRLAGGIAHDFNNLLTGVIGSLSVAQLDTSKRIAEVREPLGAAESAAYRASELVKQLLSFSRRSVLELLVCDVNVVIQRLRGLLTDSFDSSISLEVDLDDNVWNTKLDGSHLEQVLLNLCVNARDAMVSEGGGIIKVSTSNLMDEEDKEYVRICIQDTGDGMDEEVVRKIFDPFFTTKEREKGTGLGLAMSLGIIEQHGGRIECDSEPGVGSQFVILLPRSTEEVVDVVEPLEEPLAVVSEDRPRTVLFIDDEAFVRAVGEGILKHHGYTVVCARNGQEGMDCLETHAEEIDLIITDLTMPVMTGKEVLREVRKRYPQIPVLVSSGYTIDPDTFVAETGSRPDAIVSKPFSMEEMLRSVEACLVQADAEGLAA